MGIFDALMSFLYIHSFLRRPTSLLPRWLARYGAKGRQVWQQTLKPVVNIGSAP